MAKIVVLGAGIAGHTTATFVNHWLKKKHEVIVVSPNSNWNWIPSNVWLGVGAMKRKDVIFPLKPVYDKAGIIFKQAKAISIHPEGKSDSDKPYVYIEYTDGSGQNEELQYDYLVNATGPKLNFEATEGLGPDFNSSSVCSYTHAEDAYTWLDECIQRMKKGEKQNFLIGTGHGSCTCQGAAFEYVFNVEYKLRQEGVRDKALITYLTNEYELGDFGMGGVFIKRGGYVTQSKIFSESLFTERDVHWITRSHVNKVEKGRVHYENLSGEYKSEDFDFAMLIPPFAGVGLKSYDKNGADITDKMFNKAGFSYVDGDYNQKPFEEWTSKDWPMNYQSPHYENIFAAGIAFAPPHSISKPMTNKNGTCIFPTPPRTGMPSAMIAHAVAKNIVEMIKGNEPDHTASMANIGAACVASSGMSLSKGTAVAMTVFPIVPDYQRFPEYGRDIEYTFGEIGLGAHWIKHILHHLFIYKAKLKPFWTYIPE